MRVFQSGRATASALLLATGLLVAAGGAAGQPAGPSEPGRGKKDTGPKGGPGGRAAGDLRKAFDRITELSQTPPGPKDRRKLLDHATAFYRGAVDAYPDDPRKAGELAAAANDAVRGLDHARRADVKPVEGLPEPPAGAGGPPAPPEGPKGRDRKRGPDDPDGPKAKGPKGGPKENAPVPPPLPKDGPDGREPAPPPTPAAGPAGGPEPSAGAREALTRARERIAAADAAPPKGPGRDFLDAAKTAYARSRTAYEAGEYRRAGELARAAEAWSHVPDHLARADETGPADPPVAPGPKKKGPGVPPPPAPVKD